MDERQLAELFREAAADAPPAGFGHAEVVAASHRATARRRMAMAGGSALGIMVLVGSIVIGSGYLRDTGSEAGSAATADSAQGQQPPQVLEDQEKQSSSPRVGAAPSGSADTVVPGGTGEQGPASSGKVVPWPGLRDDVARAGCGPVDRELADALVRELPAATDATGSTPGEAFAVPDACPPDARAAALRVQGGALYVVLAPVRGDGPADQYVARDDGALGFSVYTPRGAVLLVLGVPETVGGQAPLGAQLQAMASALAQRY